MRRRLFQIIFGLSLTTAAVGAVLGAFVSIKTGGPLTLAGLAGLFLAVLLQGRSSELAFEYKKARKSVRVLGEIAVNESGLCLTGEPDFNPQLSLDFLPSGNIHRRREFLLVTENDDLWSSPQRHMYQRRTRSL